MAKRKKKLKAHKSNKVSKIQSSKVGNGRDRSSQQQEKKVPFYQQNLDYFLPLLPKTLHIFLWSFVLPFFLLVAIYLYHEPLLLRSINLYDEGVSVLGAKRLLVGEVPYKDFFTIYTPLKFAWLSKVFAGFGLNLLVSRTFTFLISLLGFTLLYFLFKRFIHPLFAALATLCVAAFGMLSITPTVMLAIALWFSHFLERPKSTFLPFLGGSLVALLFLLRIDFGGFVGLALLCLLVTFFALRKEWNVFFTALWKAALAFFIVALPVYIFIFQQGAWSDFWDQTIIFPIFGEYQELRHIPWPGFESVTSLLPQMSQYFSDFSAEYWRELSHFFAWYFWPIPFALAFFYWVFLAIFSHFKQKNISLIKQGILVNILLFSCAAAAFIYASHRSDIGHMTFLNVVLCIALFHLIFCFRQRLWGVLLLPIILLVALYPVENFVEKRATIILAPKAEYSFFPRAFPQSLENDNLQKVLDYFDEIPVREKVYVGVEDTSRVYINNVMLQFLLRQPVATKYHELHTGIVTKEPVQQEMIAELADVKHVVLWESFYCEDNKSCESTEVRILDEYIQENYTLVETIGKYKIMQRK